LTQTFVESVDFEVAHLSVLVVQRLAYPEIPTLKIPLKNKVNRLIKYTFKTINFL